jgi:P27 family predicted phage terminase small subunit
MGGVLEKNKYDDMKSSRQLADSQLKYYNRLVKLLQDNVTEKDVNELENAAMCLAIIEDAENGIKEHGTIQIFPNGTMQVHPYFTQWKTAVAQWEKYVSQFGLSPKARTDLGLESAKQEKPKDVLAGLMVATKNKKKIG